MCIYFVILDGAADRKIEELGGKTPLEYASTPVLDDLAKKGSQSMITIINDKIAPESDSGTMALLSYDPIEYYPGRGTLEGLGSGLTKGYKYSSSFRINFASFDSEGNFLDRRTARGLSDMELQKLVEEIKVGVSLDENQQVHTSLKAFGRHRGILSFVSNTVKLSGNVSNTDPGFRKDGCFSVPISNFEMKPQRCLPLDNSYSALLTSEYVNKFMEQSRKILNNSQINKNRIEKGMLAANCILVRDGGKTLKKLPEFYKRFNWTLGMYGQLPSEKAIADLIGAKFNYTKALELQLDNQYLYKVATELIECDFDVKYIHLKGPDEPGHDKNPREKVKALEKIDYFFMKELYSKIKPDDIIIVTCDHATPCELGIHSSDKVPLLLFGDGISVDNQVRYSEEAAMFGGSDIAKAVDILPFIRQLKS